MRRPSRLNWTAVGYQPVGMKPLTALAPGRLTSTTATALLSALATSSVWPSGERPSALGVLPAGAPGWSATETCSFAACEARSTTHTAFVFAHATNSRAPSFEKAIALGCSPTGISPCFWRVAASKASTFAPPHSET